MAVERPRDGSPVVAGSPALCFCASGFQVLDVVEDGVELVVSVQTMATICGLFVVRDEGDVQGSAGGPLDHGDPENHM
jgi:hypothetical protein